MLTQSAFIQEPETVIGKPISDFSLKNVDGRMLSLADYPQAKGFVVIFTCNHCPFAKLYTERLNALSAKYGALNVPVLAINSMDTLVYEDENFKKMCSRAKSAKFKFPYLSDSHQWVGKDFRADHTPHAYVIWKESGQWIIKYSGAIDDNGMEPDKVENDYVVNAVEELLSGKSISHAETRSVGCAIYYRE
jgi:peroxiredoxin